MEELAAASTAEVFRVVKVQSDSFKPVSLQRDRLKGFSVIKTFFPGQGLRRALPSVCSGVMCAGTSNTRTTGAPHCLPLAFLPPGAAFKDC